ncbi:hypothetical protein J6590_087359 [Homalodisca vitripennis]|nr:hypothetical protein J6590_087359 [Homalodisca vitripennis]
MDTKKHSQLENNDINERDCHTTPRWRQLLIVDQPLKIVMDTKKLSPSMNVTVIQHSGGILLQIPHKNAPHWDQFHQSADARGRTWEFSAVLSTGVKAVQLNLRVSLTQSSSKRRVTLLIIAVPRV